MRKLIVSLIAILFILALLGTGAYFLARTYLVSLAEAELGRRYAAEIRTAELSQFQPLSGHMRLQAYPSLAPATVFTADFSFSLRNPLSPTVELEGDDFVERSVCAKAAQELRPALEQAPGSYALYVDVVGSQPVCDDGDIPLRDYMAFNADNRLEITLVGSRSGGAWEAWQPILSSLCAGFDSFDAKLTVYLASEEETAQATDLLAGWQGPSSLAWHDLTEGWESRSFTFLKGILQAV